MIPDQVRIETGLLSGTVGDTHKSVRVFEGHSVRRAAGRRQPLARAQPPRPSGTACARPTPSGRRASRARRPPDAPAVAGAARVRPPAAAAPAAPPREPARAEDCLYANVWTSANGPGDKRPVMLWIYGGAFTGGSGGVTWYDGENLAAKGPVIVTFNYRLGSLGFFSHPELAKEAGHSGSGNYGMMDAIAALQWIKRNIAAFGGDPDRVTIAGESAGAIMVGALVGSPEAKGLFTRAIGQSGGWMGLMMNKMRTSAQAEADGVKALQTVGVASIAELRKKPLNELTFQNTAGLVVDGYLIPEDQSCTFQAGKMNVVDVTGSNKRRGQLRHLPRRRRAWRWPADDRRDLQVERARASPTRPTPT